MKELVVPKAFRSKLKGELYSELLSELEKREIRLDSSSIEYILGKTQKLIESQQPRFDNEELVVRLLNQVVLSEEEKKLAFNKDRILSTEVRTDFINDILDKIERPKDGSDGQKGSSGVPGKDGKDYSITDRDKLDIAESVDIKGLMTEDLFNKRNAQLIKDIQSGKIRLPNRSGGANGPEIIAKIDKALQTTDWQNGLPGDGTLNGNLDAVQYTVGSPDPVSQPEGLTWWNDTDHTLNLSTGLGPVLQVGQEIFEFVYNGTISQIDDFTPVYITGSSNGRHSIAEANNTTHEKLEGEVLLLTMDIPASSIGIATRFGLIRDVNTNSWDAGDILYLGSTDGSIVNSKPSFPNYVIILGHVLTKSATIGAVHVHPAGEPIDTIVNFWNGVFRETMSFTITSDGATITGNLAPKNGHPNMTMMFSDGFTTLITTPPATIELTAGTDTVPQESFIYIPITTKVLTVSTSEWPTTEHIRVASVFLMSATYVQDDGALTNHTWNDHVQDTISNRGHLIHITEKLRQFESQWENGAEGTASGFPTNVYINVTSGETYQLHKHTFPAKSMPTEDAHVVNNLATPYSVETNLNTQVLDALGNSLANSSFSFVAWGSQSSQNEDSHLMINLPTGFYPKNIPANAVSDANNYSVYDVPKAFRGSSFLIARFTFVLQADGTTWSLFDTEDLRGKIPNTTAGGGAGGTGVTTYLGLTDTPLAHVAQQVVRVNAGGTAQDYTSPPGLSGMKSGTIATPPTGLLVDELWEDTTASANHPEVRIAKVTT